MLHITQSLQVRLTEDEHTAFKQFAEAIGEKRSRIIRKIIRELITHDIDLLTDEKTLLKLAIRQLIGIANNLNQTTKAINAGIISYNLKINESYLHQLQSTVVEVKSALQNHIQKSQRRWVECLCPIKKN